MQRKTLCHIYPSKVPTLIHLIRRDGGCLPDASCTSIGIRIQRCPRVVPRILEGKLQSQILTESFRQGGKTYGGYLPDAPQMYPRCPRCTPDAPRRAPLDPPPLCSKNETFFAKNVPFLLQRGGGSTEHGPTSPERRPI